MLKLVTPWWANWVEETMTISRRSRDLPFCITIENRHSMRDAVVLYSSVGDSYITKYNPSANECMNELLLIQNQWSINQKVQNATIVQKYDKKSKVYQKRSGLVNKTTLCININEVNRVHPWRIDIVERQNTFLLPTQRFSQFDGCGLGVQLRLLP